MNDNKKTKIIENSYYSNRISHGCAEGQETCKQQDFPSLFFPK